MFSSLASFHLADPTAIHLLGIYVVHTYIAGHYFKSIMPTTVSVIPNPEAPTSLCQLRFLLQKEYFKKISILLFICVFTTTDTSDLLLCLCTIVGNQLTVITPVSNLRKRGSRNSTYHVEEKDVQDGAKRMVKLVVYEEEGQ